MTPGDGDSAFQVPARVAFYLFVMYCLFFFTTFYHVFIITYYGFIGRGVDNRKRSHFILYLID